MWIQETFVNETKDYVCGESDKYESSTDDVGKLFRALQREHGRCISKIYRDTDNGAQAVGWVFEKRMKYFDARGNDLEHDYYIQNVWVRLFEQQDKVTREVFPMVIGA
jgi:hypothetical protein